MGKPERNFDFEEEWARAIWQQTQQQQQYAAKVAGLNKQNAMYGGFMGAGTTALTGVSNYGMLNGWFLPTKPTPSGYPYLPSMPNLGP